MRNFIHLFIHHVPTCTYQQQLVSWSLTSLFSTSMAISETTYQQHFIVEHY